MSNRVQFDFSDEAFRKLSIIREISGSKSNAEAVRDALSIYEWFMRQIKEGNTIKVESPDGEENVVEFLR